VFEVVSYKVPLIDKDGGASGGTVTREDLARMPGRSAASIASTVGGVQSDANGNITSVRGSRSGSTFYYIDGIKVRGSTSLPKSAIEEVSVMTGGVPANFGDATGGIISITTRGASRQYFGGFEAVTSGFAIGEDVYGLDNNGYNLFEGVFSGPLLMKKDSTGKTPSKRLYPLLSRP
jgi:outer membrane receptor for ferrienterochelin and colicin